LRITTNSKSDVTGYISENIKQQKINTERVRTESARNSVWRKILKKEAKLARFVTFVPTVVRDVKFPLLENLRDVILPIRSVVVDNAGGKETEGV